MYSHLQKGENMKKVMANQLTKLLHQMILSLMVSGANVKVYILAVNVFLHGHIRAH